MLEGHFAKEGRAASGIGKANGDMNIQHHMLGRRSGFIAFSVS